MTTEIITFLGSYLLSFFSTSFAQAQKAKKEHNKHLLRMAGLREESTKTARAVTDPYTKTTRRYLAFIASTMLIVGLIVLGANDNELFIEVTKTTGGWLFMPERTITEFIPVKGIAVLVEYRLILTSVYGLYMGNNHAK